MKQASFSSGYDLAHQLTSAADSRSAYAYTYDGLGRVTDKRNQTL